MALFDALADRTRRTLYEALCEEERSVGELVDRSGLTQPHLLDRPVPLAELDAWLSRYRHLWSERLDILERQLKENPL